MSQQCRTGITSRTLNISNDRLFFLIQVFICLSVLFLFKDPLIPQGSEKLMQVSEKTDKTFSIHIDSDLLQDTNGPITHVGVLLTRVTTGKIFP